jgi:hypothetical protein
MGEAVHVEHCVDRGILAAQLLDMVDRLLGQPGAEPGLGGELGGDRFGLGAQLLAEHNPVDHAELLGALRAHAFAEQQEFLGDARRQFERVGEIFDAGDAHPHHRILEEGVLRGDYQIAHPGEHQPAGDAGALTMATVGLGASRQRRHMPRYCSCSRV